MKHTFLLEEGRVVQVWPNTAVTAINAEPYNGELIEVEGVQPVPGQIWDGNGFSEPLPDLNKAKEAARQAVLSYAQALLHQLVPPEKQDEVASWPRKEAAARAFQADAASTHDLDLLRTEAELVGEEVGLLAGKILENAEFYNIMNSRFTGMRRKTLKAIEAATSLDDLEVELENAKNQATEEMKALISQKL